MCIRDRPDITLAELVTQLASKRITVGKSSVSRFLHHLKLSFKKSLRAAEQDRPDVAAARKALQKQQPRLDPKRLVFIDETAHLNDDNSSLRACATRRTFDPESVAWKLENRNVHRRACLLYTSPSPRDRTRSRMPSSA